MAVGCVGAEADVCEDDEIGVFLLDLRDGALHGAARVGGGRAAFVLAGALVLSEEEDALHALGDDGLKGLHKLVGRVAELSGHGGDGLLAAAARDYEDRPDELLRAGRRHGEEIAYGGGAAEAAEADCGELGIGN